jgi:hypothetical protein
MADFNIKNRFFSFDREPGSIIITVSGRTVNLCRDYVSRNRVPDLFEVHAGESAGHFEVLILRRWLIEFSGEDNPMCASMVAPMAARVNVVS